MQEPKVMILVTCEDGHQVEVYPNKVLRINDIESFCGRKDIIQCVWECPRCEKPKEYEINIS